MKSNKNTIRLISYSLIALLLVLFLIYKDAILGGKEQQLKAGAARPNSVLPVKAVVMKAAPLTDKLVAAGTVIADEQVSITAETSGRVVSIHFEEGTMVKKGDLLVSINNSDLLAQIARNSYQVQLAGEREQRQRSLLQKQGISQQTYDQALTELSTLKAEGALLQAQLDKTLIKAPFAGQLGLRQISEGSYVSPGMTIVSLANTQPVKIEFSVPERYAPFITKGSPISFSVENRTGSFEASVYAIEPVVDQRTRSLPMRARYANKENLVLPGSFARVNINLTSNSDALQLLSEAIIPEMGTNKVFAYRNGKAMPVGVETGLRTVSRIEITNGLVPGDTIITTGMLQLRPGMNVSLTEID